MHACTYVHTYVRIYVHMEVHICMHVPHSFLDVFNLWPMGPIEENYIMNKLVEI